MRDKIREYFLKNKIEYFAVLDYADCREIWSDVPTRVGFSPKSAIVYLAPYYVGEGENISAYATSRDYHIFLKEIGEGLASLLSELCPGCTSRPYGDHSPIDECHAAAIGGLGVLGDNRLLINEKYGSYVFLGDVLTDISPELISANKPLPVSSCLQCGACKKACPTGKLSGGCDACLSEITQRKGEFTEAEREMMRKFNTAWGCDVCQRVCPHNRDIPETPIDFFRRDRITRLSADVLGSMSKEEFKSRAFSWRGRPTVMRNIAVLERVGDGE